MRPTATLFLSTDKIFHLYFWSVNVALRQLVYNTVLGPMLGDAAWFEAALRLSWTLAMMHEIVCHFFLGGRAKVRKELRVRIVEPFSPAVNLAPAWEAGCVVREGSCF